MCSPSEEVRGLSRVSFSARSCSTQSRLLSETWLYTLKSAILGSIQHLPTTERERWILFNKIFRMAECSAAVRAAYNVCVWVYSYRVYVYVRMALGHVEPIAARHAIAHRAI